MNMKVPINSQLLTVESKKKTKQTSKSETKLKLWTSFAGISLGRRKGNHLEKFVGFNIYKFACIEYTRECQEQNRK